MNEQDLELLITRHLDGDLSAKEQGILQARLASDPEAQRLLDEHRKLDAILASEPNLAAINWNRLADRISAKIEEAEEAPAVIYSFKWAPLAIAASVLLALSRCPRAGLARGRGLEPRLGTPKDPVLPLHHPRRAPIDLTRRAVHARAVSPSGCARRVRTRLPSRPPWAP